VVGIGIGRELCGGVGLMSCMIDNCNHDQMAFTVYNCFYIGLKCPLNLNRGVRCSLCMTSVSESVVPFARARQL
jgi:hypothetical protein